MMVRLLGISAMLLALDAVAIGGMSPAAFQARAQEVMVAGTVTALAGQRLDLADGQQRPQTFRLAAPARAEALGLRVGDRVVVTTRSSGNPVATSIASINRAVTAAGLSVRVYDGTTTPSGALGQGPGCWVSPASDGEIEMCFASTREAVALRHDTDGKLRCFTRLTPGTGAGVWTPSTESFCNGGSHWALSRVVCDTATGSCTLSRTGGVDERPTMSRRSVGPVETADDAAVSGGGAGPTPEMFEFGNAKIVLEQEADFVVLSVRSSDFVVLLFDVNQNGVLDPRVDVGYGTNFQTGEKCTVFLLTTSFATACGVFASASTAAIQSPATTDVKWRIPKRELAPPGASQFALFVRSYDNANAYAGGRSYPGASFADAQMIDFVGGLPAPLALAPTPSRGRSSVP